MLLFKASGATYRRVVAQAVHAFRNRPSDDTPDQFVLLSKNRQDCSDLEKQVQYVAKLLERPRRASQTELDRLFPNVGAGERWSNVVELYWVRSVPRPFNLSDVANFNYRHYDTVQGFAQLAPSDRSALLAHFLATNRDLLLDVVNDAERP